MEYDAYIVERAGLVKMLAVPKKKEKKQYITPLVGLGIQNLMISSNLPVQEISNPATLSNVSWLEHFSVLNA